MNEDTKNTLESLKDPYTYFETKTGLLCYTYGYHARYDDTQMVCCAVGYFTEEVTNRIQKLTGKYVQKIIYEANEVDIDTDLIFVSQAVREILKLCTVVHPVSHEKLFVVSLEQVAKIYSPKIVLRDIICDTTEIGQSQKDAITKLISLFQKYSIGIGNLGLYGSLQLGVCSPNQYIDIDLLVYGDNGYEILQEILLKDSIKKLSNTKYESIAKFFPWKIARETRVASSKIFFNDGISVDVKIINNKNNSPIFDFQNFELESEIIKLESVVTDSSEALSLPTFFTIETNKEKYTVVTRMYVYIGAAITGDKVQLCGRKVKNKNIILIADPRKHFIYKM